MEKDIKKYKLLKQLIDLAPGAIFEWNKEMYRYKDWAFTKDTIEKNAEWFTKV